MEIVFASYALLDVVGQWLAVCWLQLDIVFASYTLLDDVG